MKFASSDKSPDILNYRDNAKQRSKDVGISHIIVNAVEQIALFCVTKVDRYNRFHLIIVNTNCYTSKVFVEYIEDNTSPTKFSLSNSLFPERPNEFFSDPIEIPEKYTTVRLSFQIDGKSVINELQI